MSVDVFWASHMSYAEAARFLCCSRQNVYQECKRGKIPLDRDTDGKPGVPSEWVMKTVEMRNRDSK